MVAHFWLELTIRLMPMTVRAKVKRHMHGHAPSPSLDLNGKMAIIGRGYFVPLFNDCHARVRICVRVSL
jgi:hypothetical protein